MSSTYRQYSTDPRYPIGKHAGTRLSEIPTPYLVWASQNANIAEWLKDAIEIELDRRTWGNQRQQYEEPRAKSVRVPAVVKLDVALRLVEAGRRNMAKMYHPDITGGTSDEMQRVNASADWLVEHLEQVLR